MILFIGGACEVGKGKIAQALYDEAISGGLDAGLCMDPVESSCQEIFGKSFDHFISRRVFLHQKKMMLEIFDRSFEKASNPEDKDLFFVNESPLGVLSLAFWYGITASLTRQARGDLFTRAVDVANLWGARHLIVSPWQPTVQDEWTHRSLVSFRDLAPRRTWVIEPREGLKETMEATIEKAKEILGWEEGD